MTPTQIPPEPDAGPAPDSVEELGNDLAPLPPPPATVEDNDGD